MDITPEKALVNQPKTVRGQETLNRICQAAEQVFYEKATMRPPSTTLRTWPRSAPGPFTFTLRAS